MKIRMITLSAGPDGVLTPGQVYDLPDEKAQALVAGHYAVAVERTAPVHVEPTAEEPKPVETEVAPNLTAEKVFKPSPRRRG